MTLSKLAKLCNVSVSTASKAFSGSPDINEQTRKMIFRIARENGCFDEFFNARYPKPVIAVFCPEYIGGRYDQFLKCLDKHLREANAKMCVSITDFNNENLSGLIEYYCCYAKVDGVIIISGGISGISSRPAVLIRSSEKSSSALSEAVSCLIDEGHKTFGYIGEERSFGRYEAIKEALSKKGFELSSECSVTNADRMEKGGYEGAKQLIEKEKLPSALFCAYDRMALGAMRAIKESGKSVPEDISVCSFDNISECAYMSPSLSSVGDNIDEASLRAVKAILEMIESGKTEVVEIASETRFIKRESIGRAGGKNG